MDLIAKVVATKGKELTKEVEELVKDCHGLAQRLKSSEIDHLTRLIMKPTHIAEWTSILTKLTDMQKNISSVDELEEESKSRLLTKLAEAMDEINKFEVEMRMEHEWRKGAFKDGADSFLKVNEFLFDLDSARLPNALVEALHFSSSKLTWNLSEQWKDHLRCLQKAESDIVTSTLVKKISGETANSLMAQCLTSDCEYAVRDTMEWIYKNLLAPSIQNTCKFSFVSKDRVATLSLTYSPGKSVSLEECKECLESVLNIIYSFLFDNGDRNEKEVEVMVSEHLTDPVLSLFVDTHLFPVSTMEQMLQDADLEVEPIILSLQPLLDLLDSHCSLNKCNKISSFVEQVLSDKRSLLLYLYRSLFLHYLDKDLIQSDLTKEMKLSQDLICFGSKGSCAQSTEATAASEAKTDIYSEMVPKLTLETLHFPQCRVSKSVVMVVSLIEGVLRKVSEKGIWSGDKVLYDLIPETMNKYLIYTERRRLNSTPHIAALVYNNSKYLGMNLVGLDKDLRPVIPSGIFIEKLNRVAVEALDVIINKQERALRKAVNSLPALTFSHPSDEDISVYQFTEKVICKQLEALKESWYQVLPTDVYNMAVGRVCSLLMDSLSVYLKQLTQDRSFVLQPSPVTSFLSCIRNSIESIFEGKNVVEKYVRNWT